MTIQQITMWVTEDGNKFLTKDLAEEHEDHSLLWHKALEEYCKHYEVVFEYKEDFLSFLRQNKELVLKVIS